MTRQCEKCGRLLKRGKTEGIEKWESRRFCSHKCYWKDLKSDRRTLKTKKCKICGGLIRKSPRWSLTQWKKKLYCSLKCLGRSKGIGRRICNGYYMILTPDHPFANKSGYIYEHRRIIELHIGRYLTKKEVVHHIDNNKANNNIDNLMIFPSNKAHSKFHHLLSRSY